MAKFKSNPQQLLWTKYENNDTIRYDTIRYDTKKNKKVLVFTYLLLTVKAISVYACAF